MVRLNYGKEQKSENTVGMATGGQYSRGQDTKEPLRILSVHLYYQKIKNGCIRDYMQTPQIK